MPPEERRNRGRRLSYQYFNLRAVFCGRSSAERDKLITRLLVVMRTILKQIDVTHHAEYPEWRRITTEYDPDFYPPGYTGSLADVRGPQPKHFCPKCMAPVTQAPMINFALREAIQLLVPDLLHVQTHAIDFGKRFLLKAWPGGIQPAFVPGVVRPVVQSFPAIRWFLRTSRVTFPEGDSPLDFIADPQRAGDLYLNEADVAEQMVVHWISSANKVLAGGDFRLYENFLHLLSYCGTNTKILGELETLNLSDFCDQLSVDPDHQRHHSLHTNILSPSILRCVLDWLLKIPDPPMRTIQFWEQQMAIQRCPCSADLQAGDSEEDYFLSEDVWRWPAHRPTPLQRRTSMPHAVSLLISLCITFHLSIIFPFPSCLLNRHRIRQTRKERANPPKGRSISSPAATNLRYTKAPKQNWIKKVISIALAFQNREWLAACASQSPERVGSRCQRLSSPLQGNSLGPMQYGFLMQQMKPGPELTPSSPADTGLPGASTCTKLRKKQYSGDSAAHLGGRPVQTTLSFPAWRREDLPYFLRSWLKAYHLGGRPTQAGTTLPTQHGGPAVCGSAHASACRQHHPPPPMHTAARAYMEHGTVGGMIEKHHNNEFAASRGGNCSVFLRHEKIAGV
ncbi:hypothetical protein B0H14DRAFT_3162707 [Mycena olivaceomarginata]|nr:hypothetical protein B0H14DRAFT_3162707 [Mycena olivaceomarginata]